MRCRVWESRTASVLSVYSMCQLPVACASSIRHTLNIKATLQHLRFTRRRIKHLPSTFRTNARRSIHDDSHVTFECTLRQRGKKRRVLRNSKLCDRDCCYAGAPSRSKALIINRTSHLDDVSRMLA